MWPFSETNAAAMRTLKTSVYAESSAQSGEEHLPAWKQETKDQHGVSSFSPCKEFMPDSQFRRASR
jgi:hypothetical protein